MTEQQSSDQIYKSAKEYLTLMNERLTSQCPEYRVSINFYSEIKDKEVNSYVEREHIKDKTLLLCLFHHDACISSLILDTEKDEGGVMSISIDSKTKEGFQKRNFNKFLRAISVLLAEYINPDIKFVISYAHNPLSAIMMIKYFDVISYNMYDDNPVVGFNHETQIPTNNARDKEDLLKILIDPKTNVGLVTKVELNSENKTKAEAIIHQLIEGKELKCSTPPIGGKKIKTSKHNNRKKKRKTMKKRASNKRKY